MQLVVFVGVIIVSYILGSIPSGLLVVRLATGRDVRKIESGRTGGTNAMRAAGFWAGALTGFMDLLKSAVAVWLAQWLAPDAVWLHILAPVAAVIGHNYSIFIPERDPSGRLRLRGGAGGASAAGGAFALWPPIILIILPLALFVLFIIGYASLATMSIAFTVIVVFTYRAWIGASPWQYVVYGILTEIILMWALRPNIRRLLNGTERVVGIRARHKKQVGESVQPGDSLDHSSSSSSSSS